MKQNFCVLTSDNLTVLEKETLKCMPPFNDRDSWNSCLFLSSPKPPLSRRFPPRSLPPQDSVSADVLTKFSTRFCSWLKASLLGDWFNPYLYQIAIIYHMMFSSSLHFQTIFAHPPELVSVHTHWSHTFKWTVPHGDKAWGQRWPSWTLVCRRFTTRVRAPAESPVHCEIYLTPSLESVPGLMM